VPSWGQGKRKSGKKVFYLYGFKKKRETTQGFRPGGWLAAERDHEEEPGGKKLNGGPITSKKRNGIPGGSQGEKIGDGGGDILLFI